MIMTTHPSTRNHGCCASSLLIAFSFGMISSLIGFSLIYGNNNNHRAIEDGDDDDDDDDDDNGESSSSSYRAIKKTTTTTTTTTAVNDKNNNDENDDDDDDDDDDNIASALSENEGINSGLIGSIPLPRRITIIQDDNNNHDDDLYSTSSSDEIDDDDDDDENDNDTSPNPPSFQLQSLRDDIYAHDDATTPTAGPHPFSFNRAVVRVFDDMISRSVPLYRECMVTLLHWIVRHYRPRTTIYDLGCSTGTTIDFLGRSFAFGERKRRRRRRGVGGGGTEEVVGLSFVGVDNSSAMVEEARKKLSWMRSPSDDDDDDVASSTPTVVIHHSDIETIPLLNPSVVIMNYTLQFLPPSSRPALLRRIHDALAPGGILYLSEKVCSSSPAFQTTCTDIYQDFKKERGYTKREIARKKEALMNVLVPFREEELMELLVGGEVGFERCQVVLKWNNFTTIVAVKGNDETAGDGVVVATNDDVAKQKQPPPSTTITKPPPTNDASYANLESLYRSSSTTYLHRILHSGRDRDDPRIAATIRSLLAHRDEFFYRDLIPIARHMESIAASINRLPTRPCHFSIADDSILRIGTSPADLVDGDNDAAATTTTTLERLLHRMKPWKKGPLSLFGTTIVAEWRSDWKWHRLRPHVDPLDDHVVADVGCANGYFMMRMMDDYPSIKYLVGIDPNYKAWLEFQLFCKFLPPGVKDRMAFELMDGDGMDRFAETFDTVFCLGVLYHAHDPIGLLRKVRISLKKGGQLILDCQGVRYNDGSSDAAAAAAAAEEDDPVALFPKKRYTNARGFWFLPTLSTLVNWLTRTNYVDIDVFYREKLSTEEQRADPTWANIKSLNEGLDPSDETRTVEGYPAPYRFYVKCYKR